MANANENINKSLKKEYKKLSNNSFTFNMYTHGSKLQL
jgi:hypothetical protein